MFLFISVLPEECLNYSELNDRKRSYTWETQVAQGWCDSNLEKNRNRKSPEWNGMNWYRFVGDAGTQMLENQGKSDLISKIFHSLYILTTSKFSLY